MKKVIYIFCLVLAASCSGNQSETSTSTEEVKDAVKESEAAASSSSVQVKKYPIKSGIVTYDVIMLVGGTEMKSKKVLYFDDYGIKESEESYTGDAVKESFMSDGKNIYTIIPSEKAAYKRGPAYTGVAYKVDFSEISKKDKDEGKAKELPNETVAGKDCKAYSYDLNGSKTKFVGWNKILLLQETEMKGMKTVLKAVSIEEKEVPAEKFAIPAGYAEKSY